MRAHVVPAALLLLLMASPAPAATGGPDAYGYTFVDSDEPTGPVFDYEDLSATGSVATVVTGCDDCVQSNVPIGFTFDFYGEPATEVGISSNGFVYLPTGDTEAGCCIGGMLPSGTAPNRLVALWWADLNPPDSGTIHYETRGTAPDRRFIVSFDGVAHFNNAASVEVQMKLFEGSNAIELHFQDAGTDGAIHATGIEDFTGTLGLTYYRGTAAIPLSTAVRFEACFIDADGDGISGCSQDCDDNDPNNYPGNTEIHCNGLDENCDPNDDDPDADLDGFGICTGDCDDNDPDTSPGTAEIHCNGLDENCDPDDDNPDEDLDGFGICTGDCDDSNPAVFTDAPEVCDGVDNDCDGLLPPDEGPESDLDGDGFAACADCDDQNPDVNPDAIDDPCEDVDYNCDGIVPDLSACDKGDDDDGDGPVNQPGCNCGAQQTPGVQLVFVAVALMGLGRLRRRGFVG